jgi:D-beta-D-heptose 7-phosphate kinase/D-beta-D-heptose 1-phosphate adenosyltransferase
VIESYKDKKPRVLVVGDLMIDHYLWGSCERISPEAPVQIVDVSRETTVLGGAGNVVNNLVELGADVGVAGVVDRDANGLELMKMLENINAAHAGVVVEAGRQSSRKSRIIASNQQILRYDKESREPIAHETAAEILKKIREDISSYDLIVISDYAKGVVTQELAQGVIGMADKYGIRVLVDPKGADFSKYSGAYLLTPNRKEASLASGIGITDEKSLEEALRSIKKQAGLKYSLITLSEDGIALYDKTVQKFPTVAKEVYDVTGAGDTVIASLAFALGIGKKIEDAVRFANLASGVAVGKIGSATVTLDEIETYASSLHQSPSDAHIKTFDEIEEIVKRCRSKKQRIVFTNGCFDILHIGHVKYLQKAKSFGDVLIVGLNSDDSVRRLKGAGRPVNIAEDRAYLLAALEAVDYVVPFEQDTPHDLIKLVSPDILVKGGDYHGKEVVGSEFSGELRLVDFVDGKSTTGTIKKIQEGDLC